MKRGRKLGVIIGVVALSSCAGLSMPKLDLDTSRSGKLSKSEFAVAYIQGGTAKLEISAAATEADKQRYSQIHSQLSAASVRLPEKVKTVCKVKGSNNGQDFLLEPLLLAFVNVAIDSFFAAADNKRAELKRAAVKSYAATSIKEGFAVSPDDCLVLVRTAEVSGTNGTKSRALASVIVFQVAGFKNADSPVVGHALRPIYVYVPLAAAQTASTDGVSKINISAAITIGGIYNNPLLGRDQSQVIVSSEHQFEGIELGKEYYNGVVINGGEWKVKDGPLFAANSDLKTVGVISAAIEERGAAASLTGPTDTEKAARSAYKNAIGTIIKDIIGD